MTTSSGVHLYKRSGLCVSLFSHIAVNGDCESHILKGITHLRWLLIDTIRIICSL